MLHPTTPLSLPLEAPPPPQPPTPRAKKTGGGGRRERKRKSDLPPPTLQGATNPKQKHNINSTHNGAPSPCWSLSAKAAPNWPGEERRRRGGYLQGQRGTTAPPISPSRNPLSNWARHGLPPHRLRVSFYPVFQRPPPSPPPWESSLMPHRHNRPHVHVPSDGERYLFPRPTPGQPEWGTFARGVKVAGGPREARGTKPTPPHHIGPGPQGQLFPRSPPPPPPPPVAPGLRLGPLQSASGTAVSSQPPLRKPRRTIREGKGRERRGSAERNAGRAKRGGPRQG